jgi:hypothetical protein
VSPLYFVVPYGHLFLAAFVAVCAIAGGAMIWRGRRPGRRYWRVAGIVALGFAAYLVHVTRDAEANVTWRPATPGTAPLVGRWSGDEGALTLSADGRYRCDAPGQCQLLSGDGRWTRERPSGDVILWPPAVGPRRYVIVSYRGRLRLIDFVTNRDEWNGQFVFSQIDSAAR